MHTIGSLHMALKHDRELCTNMFIWNSWMMLNFAYRAPCGVFVNNYSVAMTMAPKLPTFFDLLPARARERGTMPCSLTRFGTFIIVMSCCVNKRTNANTPVCQRDFVHALLVSSVRETVSLQIIHRQVAHVPIKAFWTLFKERRVIES